MKNVNWARRLALKEALRRIGIAIGYNHSCELIARNEWVGAALEAKGFTVKDASQQEYLEVSW